MSAPDIMAEMSAGPGNLRKKHLDSLLDQEIPPLALVQTAFQWSSLVLWDRLTFLGNRFEFERHRGSDEVTSAFVFPVHNEFGDLADIAAWRGPAIATWLGQVSLLGEEQLWAPRLGEPLRVHETALDWFKSGRDGVVVVDPKRAAPMLREADPLLAGSVEQGQRLRRFLSCPEPRIVVPEASVDRAAA